MKPNFFLYREPKRRYKFQLDENQFDGQQPQKKEQPAPPKQVYPDIQKNLAVAKEVLTLPKNGDIILREFDIVLKGQTLHAFLVYADGMCRTDSINECILKPFAYLKNEQPPAGMPLQNFLLQQLLPQSQAKVLSDPMKLLSGVNFGSCAVFVDTLTVGYLLDVKGWEHRTISTPKNEAVIQGPHEGFNEMIRCNTALLRKSLNTPNLVMENIALGKSSQTPSAICYLKNVANDQLVEEVRHRLSKIDVQYILSSLDVEQYIEEATYLPVPQIATTERPDRVCQALVEGRVAIIVNGSSHVLIVPTTLFDLIASPEDSYLRFPFAVLIKIIRILAIVLALFAPAVFIAITNFHQELMLTDILFAIASSRAAVPFPSIVELLLMELSFELIKEAGVRVPGPVGSTLGIVGGLILGQAAVSANIVSPIMIIVVAVTGIASFAIPSYSLSFSFRFTRFLYTAGAAIAGFLGIFTVFFINTMLIINTQSFGAPYAAPIAPRTRGSIAAVLFDAPIWKKDRRPDYLNPKDPAEKAKISRKWLRDK